MNDDVVAVVNGACDDHVPGKTYKKRGYDNFKSTGIYIRLLPVVKDLFVRINSVKGGAYSFLWDELKIASLNSVTGVVVGYNQYHSRDKVRVYNNVKANISRMQGLINLLSEVKEISVDEEKKLCEALEECIRAGNALIKMMEARDR